MSREDPKDEIEEQFWEHVDAYDSAEPKSLSEVLNEAGVALKAADEMDDAQLNTKLWEVIHALALLGVFLHNTNHLSDRQLYVELSDEIFGEPMVLMPDNLDYACHIDLVSSGSEEHTRLYMKYYADEESRRRWLEDWPEDDMPDHEDPPYDRDRSLPQAESRRDGSRDVM
jgi:hypothetical protein